jgi:hypothetical protein
VDHGCVEDQPQRVVRFAVQKLPRRLTFDVGETDFAQGANSFVKSPMR